MKETYNKNQRVKVGVSYEASGYLYVDIPDDVNVNDEEAVADYLYKKEDDLPLPDETSYIEGSFEIDPETIQVITRKNR